MTYKDKVISYFVWTWCDNEAVKRTKSLRGISVPSQNQLGILCWYSVWETRDHWFSFPLETGPSLAIFLRSLCQDQFLWQRGKVGVHATVLYLNSRPARGNYFLLFPFISELWISVTYIEHISLCHMSAYSRFCFPLSKNHHGFLLISLYLSPHFLLKTWRASNLK